MTGLLTVLVPIVLSGQFVIDPYRFASSVPALPTTNLVVNLAADGDVYNTGTTQCTDGQSVETWVDATGTPQNATATGTDQPTWNAGGGTPYITFDGNDILVGAASLSTDAVTIYVVGYVTDITAVQSFAQVSDASSTNNHALVGNTTSPSNGTAFFQIKGNGAAFGTARSSTQLVNSTTAIIHGSNAASDVDRDVWIANASNGGDTTSTVFANTAIDQYSIGASYNNSSESGNLTGGIYHILIYNEEHDASERADTVAYLTDKWGL